MIRIIALCLLVASCTTAPPLADPRLCPREKTYTKAQQHQMAIELKDAGPSIKAAMVDYMKLRDKVRACRGQK